MGKIRDSSTFAGGQRNEIDRYEVPTEVSLPGFGIGMINEDFQVEDAEFVWAKCLTIPTPLDCSFH